MPDVGLEPVDGQDHLPLCRQDAFQPAVVPEGHGEEFVVPVEEVGDGRTVGGANRPASDDRYDYTYDAEGNLTRKVERATGEVTAYTYDFRNRLTGMERRSAGGIVLAAATYVYDVSDRLIVRDANGVVSATVYDGVNPWADYDATGTATARYLYGDRPDEILARARGGDGLSWYLTDRLGTVHDVANASGVVVNHITYDTFGNILSLTNPAAGDRFLFQGREWEPGLGLYYYRARWYDPGTAQFLSEDSLGFAAGDANLRRFVGNAPNRLTDPSGHVAVGEYGYTLTYMLRGGFVGGVVGAILGGLCEYLDAVFSPDPAAQNDWEARRLKGAITGGVMGAALGLISGFTIARIQTLAAQSQIITIAYANGGASMAGAVTTASAAARGIAAVKAGSDGLAGIFAISAGVVIMGSDFNNNWNQDSIRVACTIGPGVVGYLGVRFSFRAANGKPPSPNSAAAPPPPPGGGATGPAPPRGPAPASPAPPGPSGPSSSPPCPAAPKAVGRSEISNSVSNLGRGARGVDEFAPGTAFSGVYDPNTKQLLAYPSSRNPNNLAREAVLKDGKVVSENVVGRNGGHAEVNDVLSRLTKHPGANENNAGFTLFLKEDGNLRVEWFSRSVNGNNPKCKGDVVPKNLQTEIRRELKNLFSGKEIEG